MKWNAAIHSLKLGIYKHNFYKDTRLWRFHCKVPHCWVWCWFFHPLGLDSCIGGTHSNTGTWRPLGDSHSREGVGEPRDWSCSCIASIPRFWRERKWLSLWCLTVINDFSNRCTYMYHEDWEPLIIHISLVHLHVCVPLLKELYVQEHELRFAFMWNTV